MKIIMFKQAIPVKSVIVSVFVAMLLCVTLASCSSHKCDAYKSSHRYHREVIR